MEKFNNILLRFLIIVTPIIVIWLAVIFNNATTEKEYIIDKIISESQINDQNTAILIEKYLSEIVENLKVVRDADEINTFLNTATDQHYDDVTQLFVRVMTNKKNYHQIRFIDISGQEVINVRQNETINILGKDKLKNKADRYYFIDTIGLNENDVYMSPLDVDTKNGEIESPYKPILRFSTPIFDQQKTLRGILVVNYEATEFINLIYQHRPHSDLVANEFYILNKFGQFIYHPEKSKSLSYLFKNTGHLSFQEINRSLWNEMTTNDFIGSKIDTNYIYAYYDVLSESKKSNYVHQQQWVLLHVIDIKSLLSWKTLLGKLLLTSNLIIFTMIILLSFLLAYIVERLILTDNQLEITKKIAETTNDAVVITDRNTCITYVNKAYEDATGYLFKDIIGSKTSRFKSGKHDAFFYQKMWQEIDNSGHWEGMLWDKKKDGLLCLKKLKIIAIRNKRNNTLDKYIGVFTDLSANKRKTDTFEIIKHDNGQIIIPNEGMMIELLSQSIKNKNFSFIIIYLAIDNYNRIISLFDEDDHLVSEAFIDLMRPLIKEGDFVAQTGRNSFAVIVDMNNVDNKPESFVRNFHKELCKIINIKGKDLFFKTNIGISYWPQDTNDIKRLLLNSMIALEWSIRRGESEIAFFSEDMIFELNQENQIEGFLRKAVENQELSIVYQPQIDLITEKVIGMEALVRWHNSTLGNVSPALFIPIAEKSRLMVDIGHWILQTVCTDIRELKKNEKLRRENLKCAINISAIQMAEVDFIDTFFDCINRNNIKSHEIEFEITESSLLTNENKSIAILNAVREANISVAIDDFGTGYSSLSYLNTLPIDKIKIDRSFIKNYPELDDGSLVKALIEMSNTLKKKVLAEGVETKEQIDYLRTIGCDYIQGYYYSKPLPFNAFIDFILTKPK